MIKLEMKNYNMALIERLEKYHPSQQAKLIFDIRKNDRIGKAFEKQAKTIEDHGQKQIKAIEDNKNQLTNNIAGDYKNKLLISKQTEIFENIRNERLYKIEELTKKINFNNLKYFTGR